MLGEVTLTMSKKTSEKKILSMVLSQRRLEGEVKWDVKGIYPLFKGL